MRHKHWEYSILILFIAVSATSCSILEDEDRVNSEGMWQKQLLIQDTSVTPANGNSRFGMGGILDSIGLRTGASLLGLVVFPFLFPLTVIFSIALFIISMSGGTSPLVATGRRFDANGNGILMPPDSAEVGSDVLNREECFEQIGCEILNRARYTTEILRFLRQLDIYSNSVEKVDIAIANGKGCSVFKCSVAEDVSMMWKWNYAKYLP